MLAIPKHTSLLNEVHGSLEIYASHNDWVKAEDYLPLLIGMIGGNQYPSSYPKKMQVMAYYGFIESQSFAKGAPRRATSKGRQYYNAVCSNDHKAMWSLLLDAMETMDFGRRNYGIPSSDSDFQPPNILVRCLLDLKYLTYAEYSYILHRMANLSESYGEIKHNILSARVGGSLDMSGIPRDFSDPKPIKYLPKVGFLSECRIGNAIRLELNPYVKKEYKARLQALKITKNPLRLGFQWWLGDRGFNKQVTCEVVEILDAISSPISAPPVISGPKWEGLYEYVFSVRPEKVIWSVDGRIDFDLTYQKLIRALTFRDKSVCDDSKRARLDEFLLFADANSDFKKAVNAYQEFLVWYDKNRGCTIL